MNSIEGFLVGYLITIKIITTLRDVLDKTPKEDNNAWEWASTVVSKLGAALIAGKRPS